jgi:phage major head subunit gpT-like protein
VELNEATLLAGMIAIRTAFKDQAGLKVFARARKLLVPPQLEPVAIRLTKSELRPGTADNDVNAIISTSGGLPEGYMTNDYLTSATAWFLLTNIDGLSYMERVKFETDMQVDFVTDNLLVKGYERYSFGYYNWRSIWGSLPT